MLLKLLGLSGKQKKLNAKKAIKEFLSSEDFEDSVESTYKLADFARIKEAVDKGIDEEKFMKDLEGMEAEEKDIYAIKIPAQYEALKAAIPSNMSVDLFGVDEREPSDFEKSKFIRMFRVLEDPAHIVDLMKSGTLTGTEVDALKAFYPELHEELKEIILEQIAEGYGKEDSKLNRNKNHVLSAILEVPRVNPRTLEMMQNNLLPKEEEEMQKIDSDTGAIQTEVQQTLNK